MIVMTGKYFIDSNVWIYALAPPGDSRTTIAQQFLLEIATDTMPVISYQVINETIHVLKKKKVSEGSLRAFIEYMSVTCEMIGFSKEAALYASQLRESMSVSYWDSQIIASALIAECDTLISEDMQDGLLIQGVLRVVNIFK